MGPGIQSKNNGHPTMIANAITFTPDWTTPPGRTISRIMRKRGLSNDELAMEIDVSESTIEGLLTGDVKIDYHLADKLSEILGSSSQFWLNREHQFREDLRRLNPSEVIGSELNADWARQFPVKDMIKNGWLPADTTVKNILDRLLSFFNIQNSYEWSERYHSHGAIAAFRRSPTFEANPNAVVAWLRWAELQANNQQCHKWNREKLISNIPEMRKLTRQKQPDIFLPRLKQLCAEAGVAVVIAPAPTGCTASGATCFLTSEKALIVLSLRYKTDDHFWFTFFHEIGHLVLHSEKALFLEDNSDVNAEEEIEANNFSQSILISPEEVEQLYSVRHRTNDIMRLSVRLGISSGIIVGQMQHKGILGRNQMNHLKRKYEWSLFK